MWTNDLDRHPDDAQDSRAFVNGFREARRDAGIDRLPPIRYSDGATQRRFEAGWRAGQVSWLRELRARRAAYEPAGSGTGPNSRGSLDMTPLTPRRSSATMRAASSTVQT